MLIMVRYKCTVLNKFTPNIMCDVILIDGNEYLHLSQIKRTGPLFILNYYSYVINQIYTRTRTFLKTRSFANIVTTKTHASRFQVTKSNSILRSKISRLLSRLKNLFIHLRSKICDKNLQFSLCTRK